MAHYKGAASEAGRAMQLMKKRELAQQDAELRKKKIEDNLKIHDIENKFSVTHYNAVEQQIKTSTIGLVTLDEMKATQENIVKERERKLAQKAKEKEQEKEKALAAKKAEKSKQKKQIQALSFNLDEEEEDDDDSDAKSEKSSKSKTNELPEPAVKKIKKNPDVDTSFLPDREREEEENRLREELRQEWAIKQNALKEEEIEITFSYWDGSGHRRSVIMKKGKNLRNLLYLITISKLSFKLVSKYF